MTPTQTAPIDDTSPTKPDTTAEALRSRIKERLAEPPWVLLVQLFIGMGWLRAAVEKIIDPSWWNGTVLTGFIDVQAAHALPWYQAFLDRVVEPNLLLVSTTVVVAQLFAAGALLSGRRMLAGLATGAFLNLNFVAAGAVNPSAFYLICQTALVLWILHGGNGTKTRPLRLLATVSFALALLNVPFVSTLDPAMVIEDPAMMFVTLGLLTAVASRVGVAQAGGSTRVR